MDIRHLRSFLKIVETGSLTRAAVSIGISQPSLSQQMLRLEDEVGLSLFRRSARGIALTEAGRLFEEHARRIVRNAELAVEDVRQYAAEATGEVVLGVPYSVSKIAGAALAKAFLDHAPNVSFRLVEAMTGQIFGWLDTNRIDLGILFDPPPLKHFIARRLVHEEMYLVGPAGIFGALDAPPEVAVQDLAGLDLILPARYHGLRQHVDHIAARHGISLTVRLEIDAMMHVGPLVAQGVGYSIVPLPVIAEMLQAGQVSIARLSGRAGRRSLCLVRNSNQIVTHASLRCEDLTIKVLAQLIEKGLWRAEPAEGLR
jgi:LysR family nitrogen assimilation transcriptional regulator